MSSTLQEKILQMLSIEDALKAAEIAKRLGLNKNEINSVLYTLKGRGLTNIDVTYSWHIVGNLEKKSDGNPVVQVDKQLYNLCRYYLSCINLEANNEIGAFLTSNYDLEYETLSSISIEAFGEKANNLIRKANASRDYVSHVGYPIQLYTIHTKDGKYYRLLAPIFTYDIEVEAGHPALSPVPGINMKVINNFSTRNIDDQTDNLIQLEKELGMDQPDADIALDDLVYALKYCRPQWPWKEELDVENLSFVDGIPEDTPDGIYNTAIVINSKRSIYTAGLVEELAMLMRIHEGAYKNTALYQWVHGMPERSQSNTPQQILSVLPMNTEQYDAVSHSLQDSLAVITGPPGTGKSQVVTNLLINLIKNGKNVIFTSKNNKAVDVVETRINGQASRPVMLRIGSSQQYAGQFANFIKRLLDCRADTDDKNEYARLNERYSSTSKEYDKHLEGKKKTIDLRNKVDKLEERICNRRDQYCKWIGKTDAWSIKQLSSEYDTCKDAYIAAQKDKQSFLTRLLWPFVKSKRIANAATHIEALNNELSKYDLKQVAPLNKEGRTNLQYVAEEVDEIISFLKDSDEYTEMLKQLEDAIALEEYDMKLWKCQQRLSGLAGNLWNKWLVNQGVNLDADTRSTMTQFITAMSLVNDIQDLDNFPEIKKQFNQLQSKMSRLLSCWAVTALSVKSRVPFVAGQFDCVVIDEASQCDIASMLPLLYRAKRAVIIGDDKQLSHISTISKKQDAKLLEKYCVPMSWCYSQTSLFAKACELSPDIIMLKDHHRSHSDIIEFSNKEFYGGSLRIATNYQNLKRPSDEELGLRWIDVKGLAHSSKNGSLVNDTEATAVIQEIKHLVTKQYIGSIGVVTPFRAQAEYIRSLVEADQILLQRDILVDTVHKFQGDERDVMVFSPVISKGATYGAMSFLNNNGNLFNVAITRAKAVLVVIGDMSYSYTSGVDYLKHFVEYYLSRKTVEENHAEGGLTFESEWEEILYDALAKAGITPKVQYVIDKYRLDMALIIPGGKRLDIEVDGERYHKDWNGELCYRDQLRNQRMFELGWDVKRFWVYEIRDNIKYCVNEVKKWVEKNKQ